MISPGSTSHETGLVTQAATLIGLVGQFSPSGSETPAVDWLLSRMLEIGYTRAFKDAAGNAVGLIGNGPRQIVLLGHIDTVPGQVPFRLVEQAPDTLLYGRGAVDAKGPLSAFVDAAARVGPRPGWQMIVIAAVDEERNSTGARYVRDQYAPEHLIVGEPTRWDRVALGYKGSAGFKIQLRTPLAHSASANPTAAELAFRIWEQLFAAAAQFNQDRTRLFDQLLLSLRGFSSGDDGFTGWAELTLGARLPVDLQPDAYYARVSALLAAAQVPPETSLELLPGNDPIPAYLAAKNTPLVRAALSAIRNASGNPGFVLKTGTADLNIVAPAWQCPAIVYGPGDSNLDHTPHEHISLTEYLSAVSVLTHILNNLTD